MSDAKISGTSFSRRNGAVTHTRSCHRLSLMDGVICLFFFHRLMVSLISCCKLVWVLLDLKKECGLVLITRKHLRAGGRDT